MKKILICLYLCGLCLLCCNSCNEEVDLGFPKNISFTKEGGEIEIRGRQHFTHATIHDYKGNTGLTGDNEDGTEYSIYNWLKVEYAGMNNDVLKVYAAPNTTGKSRKLYIELHSGPEYHVTKVTQKE